MPDPQLCTHNIALSAAVACRNLVCRKRVFAGIHEAFMNECITRSEIHYLGSSNENHVVTLLNQRTAVKYAYTVILRLVHASALTLIRTVPPAHIEAASPKLCVLQPPASIWAGGTVRIRVKTEA